MNEIIGIVYKHDEEDYSVWLTDAISEEDQNKISEILMKYDTTGTSIRNVYEDVVKMFEM